MMVQVLAMEVGKPYSWLLASGWPSSGSYDLLGSEPAVGRFLSLSLPFKYMYVYIDTYIYV